MLFTFNITGYIPGAQVGHQIVRLNDRDIRQKIIEVNIGKSTSSEKSDRIPESTIITQCETLIPRKRYWSNGTLAQMP